MSSESAVPGRAPRAPRSRGSLNARLCSIVLAFESMVVFLGGLAVYGLGVLPEGIPDWWGIVGGGVIAVVMIAASGLTKRPAGIAFGYLLQVVVALSAILVPAMLLIALIFGGMYAYADIQGRRLESRTRPADPSSTVPEGE